MKRFEVPSKADDLTVQDWDAIRTDYAGDGPTGSLLVGNGLSRAIWDGFAYPSLLTVASDTSLKSPLRPEDLKLFSALGTKNFEFVLGALRTAALIAGARGDDAAVLRDHYERVRRGLIEAVMAVHVPWDWVSESSRTKICSAMRAHQTVYSISYDLVPYWAAMTDEKKFLDYFFADGNSFELRWLPPRQQRTRLLFPHGALHLVRRWSGVTAKLTHNGRNLLERFGEEPQAEPLFVSEGAAADKRAAIRGSDYLTYVYKQLSEDPGPFVLFGVGLGEEDSHIADALNRKDVKIAVGLHGDDEAKLRKNAAGYAKAFNRTKPVFFASGSHPLGDPSLKAEQPSDPVAQEPEPAPFEWHTYGDPFDELFGIDRDERDER